jgi:chorismate synthase
MDKRQHKRNIYNRKVSFVFESTHHTGIIDNISADGVHVITNQTMGMTTGDPITITLANAEKEKATKRATIIWADATGFGAKFVA